MHVKLPGKIKKQEKAAKRKATPEWSEVKPSIWRHRSGTAVRLTMLFVTPDLAKELLFGKDGKKQNRNFRKSSNGLVRRLVEQLNGGFWRMNGETIIIDREGYVRDGQNRLLACIQSGVSFWTVAVYGTDPETDASLDGGGSRTLAQKLAHSGETRSGRLACPSLTASPCRQCCGSTKFASYRSTRRGHTSGITGT